MGDAASYDTWARGIAARHWLGHEVFYQAPLYPYFLGLLYALFGHQLFIVRVIQVLLGATSCVLLAQAGRDFFSPRAGIIAGVLLAIYPIAIFYDGLIQKPVLDSFLLCVLLCILGRIITSANSKRWALAGVTLALLGLVRENALILAVVIALWIMLGFGDQPRPQRLKWIGSFICGLALILFPVALRNKLVGGEFHLTTSQFGSNFYIGNNEQADGSYQPLRAGRGSPEFEQRDATDLAEHALGRKLSPAEVSQYWTSKAVSFIRSNPGKWGRLAWRKWLLVWGKVELGDMEDPYTYSDSSVVLRILIHTFHFGVLCPLAAFGIAVTWKTHHQKSRWLVMMLISYAISVALFYVFGRYRFPLVPMLILFASGGLTALLPLLREKRLGILSAYGAVTLAAAIPANWESMQQNHIRAVTEYNIGANLVDDPNETSAAFDHYTRAVQLDPTLAEAYNGLGTVLARQGNLRDAAAYFTQALQLDPRLANAHYNLGNISLQTGQTTEAINQYEQALQIEPDFGDAHGNLGNAFVQLGRPAEALPHYEEALRLKPNLAQIHLNMGVILRQLGRTPEAIAHYEEAVRLTPDDPDMYYSLGNVLMQAGRLPEAIQNYEQALRLKPDFTEAQNNLEIARHQLAAGPAGAK
jgi:tetratricopeptide (TPR) repeat protein